MKSIIASMLILSAWVASPTPSSAQNQDKTSPAVAVTGDSLRDTLSLRPPAITPVSPAISPISAHVIASSVYDSNIERDPRPLNSYGFITGIGARYQDREIRPSVQLSYEIARHAYTHGDEWDRVSQNMNVVLARRLSRSFFLETIGEIALKGSSEDRDIGNQYIFLPRLNYRINSSHRLRVYGAYRIRRYDVDTDRDAANRYAGAEFRKAFSPRSLWESGFRYETNSAKGERRSYTRRTYFSAWTATVSRRDQLVTELEYRRQHYDKRPVKVGGIQTPRLDHRLQPSIEWVHAMGRNVGLVLDYEFEYRSSNDPSKGYRDHLLTLTTRYQF